MTVSQQLAEKIKRLRQRIDRIPDDRERSFKMLEFADIIQDVAQRCLYIQKIPNSTIRSIAMSAVSEQMPIAERVRYIWTIPDYQTRNTAVQKVLEDLEKMSIMDPKGYSTAQHEFYRSFVDGLNDYLDKTFPTRLADLFRRIHNHMSRSQNHPSDRYLKNNEDLQTTAQALIDEITAYLVWCRKAQMYRHGENQQLVEWRSAARHLKSIRDALMNKLKLLRKIRTHQRQGE